MPKADLLGVENVLDVVRDLYGIEGEIKGGDEFYFLCPVHEMDGQDHSASASVNIVDGLWSCWSCKASGDLAGLGKVVLKKNRKSVLKLLRPNEPSAITAGIQRRILANKRDHLNSGHAMQEKIRKASKLSHLHSLQDGPYDALYARGISDETIYRFGLRFCVEAVLERENDNPFTITNAIAIPLKSEDGATFGWCYRATEDSASWFRNVRYIYSPGVQLSEIWYGLDTNPEGGVIGITEGAIDRLWLEQHGFPALAILGSNPKVKKKIRKLLDYDEVRLFVDNDDAGRTTTFDLGQSLTSLGQPVTVVRRSPWMLNRRGEPAKDANDLCGLDLELAWERAIPFALWKRKLLALAV